jgi:DeoR family transcriptional regulator, aga operon transcriptional repressor
MLASTQSTPRLPKAERLAAILDTIERSGSVSVADLAAQFAVSASSLRRDLRILQDQHVLRRTHGGAVAHPDASEYPVTLRRESRLVHKRAIAVQALTEVRLGRTIIGLNGGTTTLELARRLQDRSGLAVVTNSIDVAAELLGRDRLHCVVLGGMGRSLSHEMVGPWTQRLLSTLKMDVVFLGADGISAAGGLTTHDAAEATVNRAMVYRSRRAVALVDGTKIGRCTAAQIVPCSAIHAVITDTSADVRALAELRAAGCAVTIVSPGAAAELRRRAG